MWYWTNAYHCGIGNLIQINHKHFIRHILCQLWVYSTLLELYTLPYIPNIAVMVYSRITNTYYQTLPALRALCETNSRLTAGFHHKGLIMRSFDIFFVVINVIINMLLKIKWSDLPAMTFVRHWNNIVTCNCSLDLSHTTFPFSYSCYQLI